MFMFCFLFQDLFPPVPGILVLGCAWPLWPHAASRMDGGATVTVSRASRVSDHVHRVKQRDLSWSPPAGDWALTPRASDWSSHKSRDHQSAASDWSRRGREQRADWSAASLSPPWSVSGSGSEEDWAVTSSSSSESPVQWTPETPETPRHRQEPDIFELLNKLQGEPETNLFTLSCTSIHVPVLIANEQRKPLIHTSNDLFPHVLSWKVLHSTSFRTWR